MSPLRAFATGMGARQRQSHLPPITGPKLQVQAARAPLPAYPFQPLPPPNGPAPFRYDLSNLLTADDINKITDAGVIVFHSVGDTGDFRGEQMDFVSAMMTHDSNTLADDRKPAFYYHLGDVVYFAGDIIGYPDNFYQTYKDYPAFIVSIAGNHDCQPDDPADGPGDPNKTPLDGWVQNFMAKDPTEPGSREILTGRTRMDLPNVYWTFTTPFATIIGLFSNVGESQGEIHQDQIDWFRGELTAADPKKALIVTVHHPPFSGDSEHSGSSAVDKVLAASFLATGRYPNLVLSGHVHNYQRFTNVVAGPKGQLQIPYIVAGAGGYKNLGKLQKINGAYPDPTKPLAVGARLTLERYDHDDFGFLRLEVSKTQIVGTYLSAPYTVGASQPVGSMVESFTIDLAKNTVTTNGGGGGKKPTPPKPPKKKKKS
ncbi:MAG TPA: metallophosphoesterase [Candidatus Sulfotelmatobacter sp.]|nr:metallophosphoesterase [Candidatus Sulfotelmatobacter sp.]